MFLPKYLERVTGPGPYANFCALMRLFALSLISFSILFSPFSQSEEQKLSPWTVITKIPETSMTALKMSFSKEAIWPWVGVIGSTALLYEYDPDILREVQKGGRDWGIGNEERTRTFIKVGQYDILRLPTDTGSAIYFFGDGWTHIGTAVGFFLVGHYQDRPRAYNTGVELFHAFTTSTIFSQIIKRATGREAPSDRTEARGKWRPFPSIAAYNDDTAKYDAMPSGHIMTATITFTVLNHNYPEYSHWIIPIGSVWVTVLGLQMVNNSVHWASDYPLGIAMGLLFGNISAKLSDPKPDDESQKSAWKFQFYPSVDGDTPMINVGAMW